MELNYAGRASPKGEVVAKRLPGKWKPGAIAPNLTDWRLGDILLSRARDKALKDSVGSQVIRRYQAQFECYQDYEAFEFTHAALYVGGRNIVEAVSPKVRVVDIDKFIAEHPEGILRMRSRKSTVAQRRAIVREALSYKDDLYNLMCSAPDADKQIRRLSRAGVNCSGLVQNAYLIGQILIRPQEGRGLPGMAALPADIRTSVHLIARDSFWQVVR